MKLYYDSGYFQAILGEERPGFEKVSGFMQGYDITAPKVMGMLTKAQDIANQSGGNLQSALAKLSICHKVKAFEKPGQKEPIVSKDIWYYILFGKKKVTYNTLSNFIKTIPECNTYQIIPYTEYGGSMGLGKYLNDVNVARQSDANWHVLNIYADDKKVTVKEYPNVIVVNPDNFKIVHSDFPEFNGDLLPVLEEIVAPIQCSPILPEERENFFGKNR